MSATPAVEASEKTEPWREFLLGDDPHEEMVRRGDWTVGEDAYRRRMQHMATRPARRRGRPRQPPPGQGGLFPEFYAEKQDA